MNTVGDGSVYIPPCPGLRLRRRTAVTQADALVLFGASGDLAGRKLLPALYQLAAGGKLNLPVVGVARSAWDDDGLRGYATRSVKATGEPVDSQALRRLLDRLMMVSGDYRDPATFTALARRLSQAGAAHPVHYLAVPPDLFATVIEGLAAAGLHRGARVLVEKPFGRDLASARRLNRVLYRSFPETAIFRIDHFLAKETVENLFAFRFANSFLEPIWNRHYLANIQVTLAEDFGVAGRGGFYDSVGATRDVGQNQRLQVLTMSALQPPADATAEALRDEKVKVVKAMPAVRQDQLVRGQYQHYRDEAVVASDSTTDTYAAL